MHGDGLKGRGRLVPLDRAAKDMTATETTPRNGQERTAKEQPRFQYKHRPDPSEPWRFACPEDGSVVVEKYREGTDRFICGVCNKGWGIDELVDRRTSNAVPVVGMVR